MRTEWKPQTCNKNLYDRNLRKDLLGGVIFGCTKNTMKECLSKQLFGLPTRHFSYVQNIDPGLPLFLFNYSDRKLHGIFEASSKGKMYMDPYAWIDDDFSDKTQYPAQVKVRVRLQCHPLSEDKFGHVIVKNYYSDNHFRFELDHRQTSKLMYLLVSMAIAPGTPIPRCNTKWRTVNQSHPSREMRDGDFKQLYNRPIKKQVDEDNKNLIYKKLLKLARDKECGELSLLHNAHNVNDPPYTKVPTYLEQIGDSSGASIENQYTVFQFVQGVEELGVFKEAQFQENFYLEQKLMKTSLEIQHVKHHYTIFESTNVEQTTIQSTVELHLDSKPSSLLKGSFEGATTNGFECLTNVDLDHGRWMSTHSILDKRIIRAAMELNLYDGKDAYNGLEYLKYTIGSFDEYTMIPYIELFNPCRLDGKMKMQIINNMGEFGDEYTRSNESKFVKTF